MKFRVSFVSNSSSCSFIVYTKKLQQDQINFLKDMDHFLKKVLGFSPDSNFNFVPLVDKERSKEFRKDFEGDENNQDRLQSLDESDREECLIFSSGFCETYPQVFLRVLGIPDDNVKPWGYIGDGAPENNCRLFNQWLNNESDYKEEFDLMIEFARKHLDKKGTFYPLEKKYRISKTVAEELLLEKGYTAFGPVN